MPHVIFDRFGKSEIFANRAVGSMDRSLPVLVVGLHGVACPQVPVSSQCMRVATCDTPNLCVVLLRNRLSVLIVVHQLYVTRAALGGAEDVTFGLPGWFPAAPVEGVHGGCAGGPDGYTSLQSTLCCLGAHVLRWNFRHLLCNRGGAACDTSNITEVSQLATRPR